MSRPGPRPRKPYTRAAHVALARRVASALLVVGVAALSAVLLRDATLPPDAAISPLLTSAQTPGAR